MLGRILEQPWLRWFFKTLAWLAALVVLLPVVLVLCMRWIDPYSSMFMLQRQIELWQANSTEKIQYQWVDAEKISPRMMLAVVAAEDQKFPLHFGFDLEAIEKAMAHNRKSKSVRGASTITQQVAKNLFLWSSRSWIRKGMEVYYTALLELLWSKQRIIEVYVNIAQFDDNVFGVEAASRRFFKKSAENLTVSEAALLAAVLPNPNRYHAENPSAFVMRRAHWIQQQMYGLGDEYVMTGVVPVRQYRANTAAPVDATLIPDEEPVDELMYEMAGELSDSVTPDDQAPDTAPVPEGTTDADAEKPDNIEAPTSVPDEKTQDAVITFPE